MEIIDTHDVLVIGGGAAGLRAAIAAVELAEEKGETLSVGLISKVYPVRSHTVSAEGGASAVLRDYDTYESHAFDTIKGSDYLADQDVVDFFVHDAPKEISQLEQWGCPWSRDEKGEVAVRAFGGMSVKRTVYAADKTGFYMLHSMFERSLKHENIVRYDEWYVSKVLVEDGRAVGVVAMNQRDGKEIAFKGKAVILCTGGAGRMFKFTTNGKIKTGDGMSLALRAGASLKDMEFVQFHPTGLVRTGILITEGARGEGGYLYNKEGERFLENYYPKMMELAPRDLISRAITAEIEAGRGVETPYGPCVNLDITHLGEKLIDERLPLVREISMDYQAVDPVKEPIPVRPVMHYFMGGIHTNVKTETTIQGLYASGETACVGMHGANRLGSNSLSECLVFGRVSGEEAAKFAMASSKVEFDNESLKEETQRLDKLRKSTGKETVVDLLNALHDVMEEAAGIIRDEQRLKDGLVHIKTLQDRYENIGLKDHGKVFNSELISALELGHMLELAECLLTAAIERKESRGSHVRTDYEVRDDEQFLHHIMITKGENRLNLNKMPVMITQWQPKERKY
jgi:succinate dehydrogenase/fumarate reductase flavoprotein subunit